MAIFPVLILMKRLILISIAPAAVIENDLNFNTIILTTVLINVQVCSKG